MIGSMVATCTLRVDRVLVIRHHSNVQSRSCYYSTQARHLRRDTTSGSWVLKQDDGLRTTRDPSMKPHWELDIQVPLGTGIGCESACSSIDRLLDKGKLRARLQLNSYR